MFVEAGRLDQHPGRVRSPELAAEVFPTLSARRFGNDF